MQQGHPRHKQLSRARREMARHRRYMFAKKIYEGMRSFIIGVSKAMHSAADGFINGVRKVMNGLADGIVSDLKTEHKGTPEAKDIYSGMHNPKGLMKIVPPKFNQ